MSKDTVQKPETSALQVCNALSKLDKQEQSRAIALFVGMQEVEPGVFRADLSVLNKDRVVAAAVLAQIIPRDRDRGTHPHVIVYCFPGLPPR